MQQQRHPTELNSSYPRMLISKSAIFCCICSYSANFISIKYAHSFTNGTAYLRVLKLVTRHLQPHQNWGRQRGHVDLIINSFYLICRDLWPAPKIGAKSVALRSRNSSSVSQYCSKEHHGDTHQSDCHSSHSIFSARMSFDSLFSEHASACKRLDRFTLRCGAIYIMRHPPPFAKLFSNASIAICVYCIGLLWA